jgi:solute carrier family 35 protein F5
VLEQQQHCTNPRLDDLPMMQCCGLSGRFSLGIFLLLCVVLLWVSSSAYAQTLYVDEGFDKPFFLTYVTSSSFSVYLLVLALLPDRWRKRLQCSSGNGGAALYLPVDTGDDASAVVPIVQSTAMPEGDRKRPPATLRETAELAAQWGLMWVLANWTFNLSLSLSSVSSATILSSLSVFFTLILGAFFKVETLSWVNLVAVVLCIGGVAIISVVDEGSAVDDGNGNDDDGDQKRPHALLGDMLAIASAAVYACYTVFLKVKLGDEDRVNVSLFMGLAGLTSTLTTWPAFFLLHWSGLEVFEWPSSQAWASLVLLALVGSALSDYLWLLSALLTSPLVVSIGDSLSIPFALLSDVLLGRVTTFHPLYLLGSALVLLGFFVVIAHHAREASREDGTLLQGDERDGTAHTHSLSHTHTQTHGMNLHNRKGSFHSLYDGDESL